MNESSRHRGAAKALLEWARGFDQFLRLNVVCESEGDRALVTSTSVPDVRYIDGRVDKRLDFALVLVEPWSEGYDMLNSDAMAYGEAWLDWVYEHQEIEGLPGELIELAPDDMEPVVVMVMADAMCAKYQFQAHVIYRS